MNALYWNCRGLGSEETRSLLLDMMIKNKPLLVGIAEPKIRFSSIPRRFMETSRYSFVEEINDTAENLWIFIRNDMLRGSKLISKTNQQVTISVCLNGTNIFFSMLYGSCTATIRRDLWKDLRRNKSLGCQNWFVMGDFNICLGAHEKMGGVNPRAGECRDFMEAISDCDLSDLQPTGPLYTWTNNQDENENIQIRLDRILHDDKALEGWDSIKNIILPRHGSDHSPLLLMCKKGIKHDVKPFRFRSMWTDHHSFMHDTERFWTSLNASGNPVFALQTKLKQLRQFLREWNKTVFGNIDHELEVALHNLSNIQSEQASIGRSEEIGKKELEAHDRINFLLESKKKLQSDACKVRWLQHGDRNSAFFHALHSKKKTTMGISHLMVGDNEITDDVERIENEILSYYEQLFNVDQSPQDFIPRENVIPALISDSDNKALLCTPTDEEIKATVFNMDSSSAPGPDGFTGHFFQKCWNFVHSDVVKAIQFMFTSNSFPSGVNSIFMVLIPKIEDATSMDQFRPIALGNFVFKVVTKIVGDRLAPIVTRILSPNQFGFVRERHIETCMAGVSESFNLMHRKKVGDSLAFKMDIKKAFDTINWDFIFYVLGSFGFDSRFCNWVTSLLHSARISILINGTPKGYFKCSRGVRQGDPISPLLFVIAEDYLSRVILKRVLDKELDPIKSTRGSCPSHFLYADDVIFFCKASIKNAKALQNIIHDYGIISGQQVNSDKSSLFFGKETSPLACSRICRILGVRECSTSLDYLGVPIFNGKVRRRHLRAIHDRILTRLSSWKGNTLSAMGRLALIQSVIYGSLSHSFMIYRWPQSLLKEMEKCMRNFFWTGSILNRSRTSVSWSKCCLPKENGGLGFRKLSSLNEAFLAKFAFNVIAEKGQVQNFLKARFLHKGKTWNCPISSTIWLSLKKALKDVSNTCQWIPGTSSSLLFWYDNWLGYRIVDKMADLNGPHAPPNHLIKDLKQDGTWNLPRHHNLSGDILSDVHSAKFGKDDVFVCRLSDNGTASIKCFYNWLEKTPRQVEWGKLLWKSFILPSRSLHCWRLLQKRIPVDEMFKTQGIQMASQCSLCLTETETLHHVFFECRFAISLWKYLSGIFHLPFKILSPWDLFTEIRKSGLSSQLWTLWQVGFFECLWLLWHVRNQIRHEEKHVNEAAACKLIHIAIFSAKIFKKGNMHNSVKDLLVLHNLGIQGIPCPPKVALPVIWCPPQRGVVKINIDGAVSGGKAAIGGVFRFHNGSVLTAFTAGIQVCTPLEAEIRALITAVQQVKLLGLRNIWIETDSSILFRKLNSACREVPWSVRQDWEDLLVALQVVDYKITHIFREGNRVADFLAKLGFVHNDTQWLTQFPRGMIDLLQSDATSLGSFRIR